MAMQIRYGRMILAAVLLLGTSACASYVSKSSRTAPVADGLVYYMPKRPIMIQVIVTGGGKKPVIETPAVISGEAVPDLANRFVLSDEINLVGDNHVAIGVSAKGLLQSANSTATSGIDTILKNIATVAGEFSGLGLLQTKTKVPIDRCKPGKTYNFVIWPPDTQSDGRICGFWITVDDSFGGALTSMRSAKSGDAPPTSPAQWDNAHAHGGGGVSGLFYKTEIPYLIKLTPLRGDPSSSISFVAYSPNEAPISFLPIKKILFAKNTVNITMTDGEVTGFDQDNTGELVGLSQIPADVIDAYFTAISKIIPQEVTANTDRNNLAVSDTQRKMCAAAIFANPIKGKKVAEQTLAYSNIKAACTTSVAAP